MDWDGPLTCLTGEVHVLLEIRLRGRAKRGGDKRHPVGLCVKTKMQDSAKSEPLIIKKPSLI